MDSSFEVTQVQTVQLWMTVMNEACMGTNCVSMPPMRTCLRPHAQQLDTNKTENKSVCVEGVIDSLLVST